MRSWRVGSWSRLCFSALKSSASDENDSFSSPLGCAKACCSGVISKPSVEALVNTLLDGLDTGQLTFALLQSTRPLNAFFPWPGSK